MEEVYLMECYDNFGGPTMWYAVQITDVGNTVDLVLHDIKTECQVIELARRLAKRYKIVVDEPEEIDPIAAGETDPIYRKITNENLVEQLSKEGIIKPPRVFKPNFFK